MTDSFIHTKHGQNNLYVCRRADRGLDLDTYLLDVSGEDLQIIALALAIIANDPEKQYLSSVTEKEKKQASDIADSLLEMHHRSKNDEIKNTWSCPVGNPPVIDMTTDTSAVLAVTAYMTEAQFGRIDDIKPSGDLLENDDDVLDENDDDDEYETN